MLLEIFYKVALPQILPQILHAGVQILIATIAAVKMVRTKRSYADKCTITWKESWMGEADGYKDTIGDWAMRENNEDFKCNWCGVKSSFKASGIASFKSHAKSTPTSRRIC